jgi:hypothetical protein
MQIDILIPATYTSIKGGIFHGAFMGGNPWVYYCPWTYWQSVFLLS